MSVASVTIAPGAWADPRVHRLARLLGLSDPRFALIMLGHLWARCTFLGTDCPPLCEIEACFDERGPELLVKCGLAEQLEGGLVRIRGGVDEDGKDRLGWFRNHRPESVVPGRSATDPRVKGGLARARAGAQRNGGRFVKSTTTHQLPPAADVSAGPAGTSSTSSAGPSGSGSGSEEKVSPAHAGSAGPAGTSSTSSAGPPAGPAGTSILAGNALGRVRDQIWTYGLRKHLELRSAGIDPHAQAWSAGPTGTGADDLRDRVRELAEQGKTADEIIALGKHVIDVRAAEARAFNPPHLRYFIASRMFTAEAFTKGCELSPAQAAAQAGQGRAGPGARLAPPSRNEPERRRSEPFKPS